MHHVVVHSAASHEVVNPVNDRNACVNQPSKTLHQGGHSLISCIYYLITHMPIHFHFPTFHWKETPLLTEPLGDHIKETSTAIKGLTLLIHSQFPDSISQQAFQWVYLLAACYNPDLLISGLLILATRKLNHKQKTRCSRKGIKETSFIFRTINPVHRSF